MTLHVLILHPKSLTATSLIVTPETRPCGFFVGAKWMDVAFRDQSAAVRWLDGLAIIRSGKTRRFEVVGSEIEAFCDGSRRRAVVNADPVGNPGQA